MRMLLISIFIYHFVYNHKITTIFLKTINFVLLQWNLYAKLFIVQDNMSLGK